MTAMSNFLENRVLNHVLGTTSYTAPAGVYLALFTTNPGEDASGTEVSGNGYSRQLITFGSASNGSASNTSEETFTASGGNFGTVTHIAIYDAATSGNMLLYQALTTPRPVNNGETITLAVGNLTFNAQ